MSSTYHYHPSSPLLRVSSKPNAVLRGRDSDSFELQRDLLMSIIHQHFDHPDEEGMQASNLQQKLKGYQSGGMMVSLGNQRRNLSTKQVLRHRRRPSVRIDIAVANEPNIKKARRVSNINSIEDTPSVTSSKHEYHYHRHGNIPTYTRPSGPELVSPRHPSCSNLPQGWSYIHDRFIAYLSTHSPLHRQEEWRTEEIALLLGERFPGLFSTVNNGSCGLKVRTSLVWERILGKGSLLDEAGNNEYFDMQYGAYEFEKWGRGI